MFKDVSVTLGNFTLMKTTVFEIAGGGRPKGLVKEGLGLFSIILKTLKYRGIAIPPPPSNFVVS